MEKSRSEDLGLPHERVQLYQHRAERVLNQYGRDFTEFTRGVEQLLAIGDELIKTYEASGYNILRRIEHLPITSREPLIFYSNFSGRTRHFGLLLSEMEQQEQVKITPEQVRFGVRASKVVYGGWKVDPINERIVDFQRVDAQGNISHEQVSQTVDTVVVISPKDGEQALEIARFLESRAKSTQPEAIEDSFETPDIRATIALRNILIAPAFEEVVANILRVSRTRLLVARQQTRFTRPWRNVPFTLNEELTRYLASRGVLP